MVVPQCPSPLTLPAFTPPSSVVQPVSWLYQEHLVPFLPIYLEKILVIRSPTCPEQTRILLDLIT